MLGGMLMSKDAIGEVSQTIDVTDFYQPKHQTIYNAIIDLFSASQPVDVVLVANQLLADGNLDKVGGADYLHSLVASVPTAANAMYYAEIVHQRAILRNVIAAGTKIAQLGYSAEGSQAEDVVNLAQSEIYEMSMGKVRQDYAAIGPGGPRRARPAGQTAARPRQQGRADRLPRHRRRDPGPAARTDGRRRRTSGHG